jgi:hypothetical protein
MNFLQMEPDHGSPSLVPDTSVSMKFVGKNERAEKRLAGVHKRVQDVVSGEVGRFEG